MIEDFAPFKDKFGLISGDGKVSQNGVLFSTEYLSLLSNTCAEFHTVSRNILSCFFDGLLFRSPDKSGGQDSIDNYMAFAHYCSITKQPNLAREIIRYGREHYGFFINDHNVSLWKIITKANLWRFFALFTTLKMVGVMDFGKIESEYWCYCMRKAIETMRLTDEGRVFDQDGRALSWHMKEVCLANPSFASTEMINLCHDFSFKFEQKIPGGMGKLRGDYFNNTNHPLAIHLEGVY